MRCVAFVRNLNQGQSGHPTTAQLLAAFSRVGCPGGLPVGSNGTVVFEAADPDAVVAEIELDREMFWLPLQEVGGIAEGHAHSPDVARRELTVHAPVTLDVDDRRVMEEARRRRLVILDSGLRWTVSLNERPRESNATPVLERLTGAPATSRGIPTVVRLIDRVGV